MNRWRLRVYNPNLHPWRFQRRWQIPAVRLKSSDHDANITIRAQSDDSAKLNSSTDISDEADKIITTAELDMEITNKEFSMRPSTKQSEAPSVNKYKVRRPLSIHDFWDPTNPLLYNKIDMYAETGILDRRPLQQLQTLLEDLLPSFVGAIRRSPPDSSAKHDFVGTNPVHLYLGWHLVQLPFSPRSANELPDGTDDRFLPGPADSWPFRYWCKGSIDLHLPQPPLLDGDSYDMIEAVEQVHVSGSQSPVRAYVDLAKYFAPSRPRSSQPPASHWDLRINALSRPWNEATNPRGAHWTEKYTILFSREPLQFPSRKVTILPREPMFSHAIILTAQLLFRWSALTYNAHLIHVDREFARSTYKLRDLLVQGTLALIVMLEYLRRILSQFEDKFGVRNLVMRSIHYTNVRPIYVDTSVRLCVDPFKKSIVDSIPRTWSLWIESQGPEGLKEVAFRATVEVDLMVPPGPKNGATSAQEETGGSDVGEVIDRPMKTGNLEEQTPLRPSDDEILRDETIQKPMSDENQTVRRVPIETEKTRARRLRKRDLQREKRRRERMLELNPETAM